VAERSRSAREDAGVVAELIAQVSHRLRRAGQEQLEPYGITWGQLRMLRLLSRQGEPMRMSELARAAGVVPRSATSVVDDLEAGGFVRRLADPADRRATLVEMTDRSVDVLSALRAGRTAGAQRLLDRLDPDQQAQLRSLLEELLAD